MRDRWNFFIILLLWVYFFGGVTSSWELFLSDKITGVEEDLFTLADEVESCLIDDATPNNI